LHFGLAARREETLQQSASPALVAHLIPEIHATQVIHDEQ